MEGYAKIAERMARLPGLAIYRGFSSLRLQTLLYMQAELIELEAMFRDQAVKDSQSQNDTEKLFSRDCATLSSPIGEKQCSEQWRLALQIRDKLEKYGREWLSLAHAKSGVSETHMPLENALLRHNKLSTMLPKPRKHDLDILVANLDDPRLPDYVLDWIVTYGK